MKAVAVFPETKEVKLADHPEPSISSGTDVKLRMLEVGVCGTDKEICRFDYGTPPPGSPYLVIGHESLAEVVDLGADVSRVRPGDLVVTSVRRACPHETCVACRAGRPDFCFTGDFTERGIKQRHGFMTELVVDDEQYLSVVPADLREVGVLVEPLTIAEKALTQVWQVQQRLPWGCPSLDEQTAGNLAAARDAAPGRCHTAVVLGAGPVGLLGAMALVTAGFTTTVYSRETGESGKARTVRLIGARYVSAETHTLAELAKEVGGIDLVYEAVGASSLAFDAMKVLGTNGVFVFTGVPGRKAPMPVDTDLLMRNLVLRNQVAFGTVNAGRDAFDAAIRDLGIFSRRFPAAVQTLITARVPIEAHAELLLGNPGGTKNVIVFSHGE